MKVKLDRGAFMPERAHPTDAGMDLRTPKAVYLAPNSSPNSSVIIDTGVHIELPHGYFGKIESKSGLNTKYGIVSLGGVIDEGYTGSIVVKIYNMSESGYLFDKGDKIAQLIIQPYLAPELEQVKKLEKTDRGDAGFGSTGR